MTPADVLDILLAIETGERKIDRIEPETPYSGDTEYFLDDGTKVVVFCDCGCWDYVDSIIMPDGTALDFWEDDDDPRWETVRKYEPPQKVVEDVYKMWYER